MFWYRALYQAAAAQSNVSCCHRNFRSTGLTIVTFEETYGKTLVTINDLYLSKEALDKAMATDSSGAMPEQLEQLEHLVKQKSGK